MIELPVLKALELDIHQINSQKMVPIASKLDEISNEGVDDEVYLELKTITPICRALWKTLNYESSTVYLEDKKAQNVETVQDS